MPIALRDIAALAGVVAVVTAIASLFGAANLGTALSIAQIAFAISVVSLILRR